MFFEKNINTTSEEILCIICIGYNIKIENLLTHHGYQNELFK